MKLNIFNGINLYKLYLLFVFLFFFMSAASQAFLPSNINSLGVAATLLVLPYYTLKGSSRLEVMLIFLLILLFVLSIISLNNFSQDILNVRVWSLYIILFMAFSVKRGIGFFIPFVKVFIIINFFVLILEKINGIHFIQPLDVNPYGGNTLETSSRVYGQGLFSYAKNAAEFVMISTLFFRKNFLIKGFLLFSALLIGIRIAIFGIAFIIVVDFILSIGINRKVLYKIILAIFFTIAIVYSLGDIIYTGRFSSAFDLSSGDYTSRFYIVSKHLDCYSNIPFFQQLFGSGFYCATVYMWGSESFPIQILTYYGLIFFLLYLFLVGIIFIKILTVKNSFFLLYPFILIFFLGIFVRLPTGWFAGSVVFGLLFQFLFSKKQWLKSMSLFSQSK